jgi:hypothetical protein
MIERVRGTHRLRFVDPKQRGKIERGKYIGKRVDEPTEENAGDFERCPGCGQWIDCRDLADVFAHAGPLPHTPRDRPTH